MDQTRVKSDDHRLAKILKRFRDRVAAGSEKRLSYDNYKMLQGFFEQENCDHCGCINYMYITNTGRIICPDCTKRNLNLRDYNDFLANEVIKLYKEIKGIEEEDLEEEEECEEEEESPVMACRVTQQDPNSGIKRFVNDENVKNNEVEGECGMMNLNMNGLLKGMQFGMISGDDFKLSPKGIAFKTADGYAVYDTDKAELTDVSGMVFDMDNAVMAMPVAQNKVKENDIIIHSGAAVVVKEVKDSTLVVVYPFAAEVKEIIPMKSIFGFNFYTKLSPLFDMGGADEENPFGKMMPFMLMSDPNMSKNPMMMMAMMGSMGSMFGGDDKEGDSKGFPKEMMMAMAMGQMGQANDQSVPGNPIANPLNNMMMAMAMSKMF